MPFLNQTSNGKQMVDKVFKAAVKAKEAMLIDDENVVNATLGTLFDETGQFVALNSVWGPYETIPAIQKAKYAASIQGNPRFRDAVKKWLFQGVDVPCEIIATPGGAGAVSSTLKNVLDPGQIVIKPSLAWGPYQTMATEFQLQQTDYNLFANDAFDLDSFMTTCTRVMREQGKVLAIINDPCHNPSGYSMTDEEWDRLIAFAGDLGRSGPVILLHDIAYVDYTTNPDWKQGLQRYASLPENVMVVIAFSLSKTFTAYGMRVGAAVAITTDDAQRNAFKNAMIYSARSIWSTVNNSVMELFAQITSDTALRTSFLMEKQTYVDLMRKRSDIFLSEAKAVDLALYPYREGFFATIVVEDGRVEALNVKLQQAGIFLVEVHGGLRVALCSVPSHKLRGLAQRIKHLMS